MFPHIKRLHRETGDNRLAWCRLLDSLRRKDSGKFRRDLRYVVHLTVTYIGILDATANVERCFARIQRLEIKSRERHCHPSRLQDSLNIVLEVTSKLDALATRTPEPIRKDGKAPLLQLLWRPGPLLCKAQQKYAECFGRKSCRADRWRQCRLPSVPRNCMER